MTQQRHWDTRAALNFILGGAGSGLLAVLGVAGAESPPAIALALALVAAGLFSVWMEIGRKLRALHVLFNPFTSWMTRESFVAVLLFPLGIGAMLVPAALPGAAIAGFAFLFCQAQILRAAKGIPAWRAPEGVPLVVACGLAEGAALLLFFTQDSLPVLIFAAAAAAREVFWRRYRAAVQSPALELRGTLAVLALVAAGFVATEALLAAAIVAIAGGWWLKLALVTRAAPTQGLTLPRVPVRGAR